MSAELTVTVTEVEGNVPVQVLTLEGEVNSITYEILKDTAMQVISDGGEYLLLDLGGVEFMSSAGLRAIHAIYLALTEIPEEGLIVGETKSPYLKVVNASSGVLKVIRATGLDQQIDVFDSHLAAMASFEAT